MATDSSRGEATDGSLPLATDGSLRDRVEDAFWARHANPWSGWTRMLSTPALVYAVYRRNWRLLGAVVAFVAVNPVLFPRPESTEGWFSRGVLAERRWLGEGRGTVGLTYPNVLNAANLLAFPYALYAAYRRRPARAVAATAVSMALKLWWVNELVRAYDEEAG